MPPGLPIAHSTTNPAKAQYRIITMKTGGYSDARCFEIPS